MTIFIGNTGQTYFGNVTDDGFVFGNGTDDFVQTLIEVTVTDATVGSTLSITQTGGNISNDVIIFGNGAGDNVQTVAEASVTNSTVTGSITVNQTSGNISQRFYRLRQRQ